MAGVLRRLTPTLAPTGRVIRVRQLVAGNPRASQFVEVRLGCREDKADFNTDGFCLARKKGSFDQCARRVARGTPNAPSPVVCGAHGGGHAVRQRNGTKLSPQQAGRLSGLARRIKRDGRVDLSQLSTNLPWIEERMQRLREEPALLDLQEDALRLTALRDFVFSGQIDMEPADLVRLLAVLTQVKATALKTRYLLETSNMVPAPRVKGIIANLIDIMQRHVPGDRLPDVARELRLLAPNATLPGDLPE